MEIRVITIEGEESIDSTIDAFLSQEIDLEASNAETKATDNDNKIKEEDGGSSGLVEGMNPLPVEKNRIKEEIDDGDDVGIKVED
jgi:hypothetical protein